MAKLPKGVTFTVKSQPGYGRVLTPEALAFVAQLHRAFEGERQQLLELRAERQKLFDKGALPDFLASTAAIRAGAWKVAPIPPGLQDRRVEITAPTERKTAIEAFNSGARVYVADFGDSNSPTWDNMVQGQINLMDRWTGKMELIEPASGRRHSLAGKPAVLMVRPRGLHLDEAHMRVDGKPVAAGLFDFGLYFFHNARTAIAKTSGPYFYLPQLESHLEARLWNQVFILAESVLALKLGTIKATVLIETLPAVFEMDEIIFELRDHLTGLSCGHSGLIFSFIKSFSIRKNFVLPDRSQIAASQAFLSAPSMLLVKTCHRRGCLAIGGAGAEQTAHEARHGFDGTGVVADPDLVAPALKIFNELMPTSNQLYVAREDVKVGQKEMLEIPQGARTEAGFRENLRLSLRYIEAWLRGTGTIRIDNRMVDTAEAEIVRAQIWQWLKLELTLAGGRKVTRILFNACLEDEMKRAKQELGAETHAKGRFKEAAALMKCLILSRTLEPFFSAAAFRHIDR